MPDPINSAVVIAKLLDCEGFSDHTASQVKRYWDRNCMNPRAKGRKRKTESAFREVMAGLSDAQKLILGKFISLRMKQSFDTGLRIGLTAFLHGARAEQTDSESS